MSLLERDSVLVSTTKNGDPIVDLPFTRVNNVEGLGRSPNTTYSVGDVVCTDNNKKVALKCTKAGTTSNTELDISTKNIGDTVTDGTVVWRVCNRTSDVTSVNGKTGDVVIDFPVGYMHWSIEPTVPAGRLPALGATYNRALYADLWAWANEVGLVKSESEWQAQASANDGNCAYYSDGDGSTTFRVPSIKCWVKGAGDGEEVGSYLEAGLPNITGKYHNNGWKWSGEADWSGAFEFDLGDGKGHVQTVGNNGRPGFSFNANRCSPVYRDDIDTVQPKSIVGQWLIVAFGVAHNIGEADVADVMQAVEQVQTSVGTLEQGVGTLEQGVGTAIDYIVESYRNGTEWYEVYKSGKVRQGGVTTPPNNSGSNLITLLKPYANTNYKALCSINTTKTATGLPSSGMQEKTTTTVRVWNRNYNSNTGEYPIAWECEGQGA